MESLMDEINNIQNMYSSHFWKQLETIDILGKQAGETGDPSLILAFCHEIYTFLLICETNFQENHEISEAVRLYNSGMNIEYAECYMSSTYRLLQKIKKHISNCA